MKNLSVPQPNSGTMMKRCTLSTRAGALGALAQTTLPRFIGIMAPPLRPRGSYAPAAKRIQQPEATQPFPKAREAAWYDEYYHRAIASAKSSDVEAFPRSLKTLGPWYYFMIPELRSTLRSTDRILELGCGQGGILRYLAGEGIVRQENIHGLDQSRTAVDRVKEFLPDANITTGDIYRLEQPADFFPACLLMETIEHLEDPQSALVEILRVIAPGGRLFLSFPNFLHLPWLAVRLLSDLLNKPNWIVRQPVDRVHTVFSVIRLARRAGFQFEKAVGSNYGPPVLYPLEKEWVTRTLNALGLWWLSFHPILVFRKPRTGTVAAAAPVRPGACPRRWTVIRDAIGSLSGRLVTCLRQYSRIARWTRQICRHLEGVRPA